ncbi:MAG: PilZ domain-containing protein [Wenzhouxiangella sp.]|jgi:hypothetical protein|nr:PilZ domain-containing protein [Wenzhouxiangella sp.]
MSEDRRQFQRVHFDGQAKLQWDNHSPVTVQVENLSLKGVLLSGLEGKSTPEAGQQARLEISLSPDALVDMALEIAFVANGRLGASWVEIDIDGMTHLRRLIALNLGDAEQVDEELFEILHREV